MAEAMNINTDKLIEAAATVADHLRAAAIPPTGALPPAAAPSPADLAAGGVADILQAKIDSAAIGFEVKGPTMRGLTSGSSARLRAHDTDNADRIDAVKTTGKTRENG